MALDKLVDSTQLDADLTSVANAIRTKGGTSGQLAFPAGFLSAVQAIPTGGASPTLVTKSITENGTYAASSDNADGYSSVTVNVAGGSGADTLAGYLQNTLTSYTLPDGPWRTYGLRNAAAMKELIFPAGAFAIPEQFCYGAGIEHLFYLNATSIGQSCFDACKSLLTAVISGTKDHVAQYMFRNCTALTAVDMGEKATYRNCFYGCSSLTVVVLRRKTLTAIDNVNAFSGTPFASGGAGGTLYVPQALADSYRAASGWSTILGYGDGEQNQILPIEGSIYETQYVDGTPIPTT